MIIRDRRQRWRRGGCKTSNGWWVGADGFRCSQVRECGDVSSRPKQLEASFAFFLKTEENFKIQSSSELSYQIEPDKQFIHSLSSSPHRNRTRGPARHRAVQQPGLHRLPVAGSVQRDRPHQIGPENSRAGPDSHAARRGTCGSLSGVLPGQASGIQLRSITPHHPANVSRNRSVASGQHRWELLWFRLWKQRQARR